MPDQEIISFEQVCQMFPYTKPENIEENLPFILAALKTFGLYDRDMVLMALATIRAEVEMFKPISEFQSKYNTESTPFDKYDWREDLGNQGPPDGANFKGRGYIQITGRDNYTTCDQDLGLNGQLLSNPDIANDPEIAADILALYLKRNESRIRSAIAKGDLRAARRVVNGGSHGLDRFEDAWYIGDSLI